MGLLDWQKKASCNGMNLNAFFPDEGELLAPEVIAVCHTCPVRDDCLAFALDYDQKDGVWGGLTEQQRMKISKTQSRVHCPDCHSDQVIASEHAEVCINCGLSWPI